MMTSSPPISINSTHTSIAPSTILQNGTATDSEMGAIITDAPMSNGMSMMPAQELPQTPNGTIEEKKQMAKAIMAASTRAPEPTKRAAPAEQTRSPSTNGTHANGSGPSRKRSRSGTRLQNPQPTTEHPVRTKEGRDAVLHEQYFQHDMIAFAETSNKSVYQSRELESSRVLKNWWKEYNHIRAKDPAAMWGAGYAGYGNGITNIPGPSRVVFPHHRRRPAGRKSKELYIDRKDRANQADQTDELVPIRLDIEWDKIRLRDTFTWNIHDRVVSPELFAEQLVEDFKLPLEQCQNLVRQIAASIEEQIQDFHPHIFIEDEPLDAHLPYFAYKNDEMRITIQLNITIGQHTLMDQFEWEINNPMNSPEEFAQQMTNDLCLSGEFTTAIAHSIREQSQLFTRSLYVTGHPFDGRPIEDHELVSSFLPSPLPTTFRPYQAAKDFTPYLFELNEIDLEKTELSLSREERRQKRSTNRRGGPALPDLKDRRRTIRTLVVSSVLPDAAESIEDSRILKRSAASGKGRRSGTGHRDGGEDSDESESDGSPPGSPAVSSHLAAGTARTRNIRGAANAAQVAMRAGIGRSATPESVNLHHHETRTSGRRVVGREYRETSSPEPQQTSLIVKLRIPRLKFQQFLRDQRAKSKDEPVARPSSSRSSANTTPAVVPAPPGAMGPPSTTPRAQSRGLPEKAEKAERPEKSEKADKAEKVEKSEKSDKQEKQEKLNATGSAQPQQTTNMQLGRIDAAGPPSAEHPMPPPPQFLINALNSLRTRYPHDAFEGTMRYTAVSTETDEPISLRPDAPPPPNTKFCYYPRIKCKDCPGKLYTPGPLTGVENFEVHLRNRHHRDRVSRRVGDPAMNNSTTATTTAS